MTVGQRLKAAMDMKGINQKELAELLDTTEVTISRYVNDVRSIKMEYIIKICKVLNISSDWLLGIKINKKTEMIYDKEILNKIKLADDVVDTIKKYIGEQ